MRAKPFKIIRAWKYTTESFRNLHIDGEQELEYGKDADGALSGIQGETIFKTIPYDAASEVVQLFLIQASKDGKKPVVEPKACGATTTLRNSGGIDAEETSLEVDAPAKSEDFRAGSIVKFDGSDELLTIESIQTNTPISGRDTWTVRRGDHGTTAESHAAESLARLMCVNAAMVEARLSGTIDTALPDAASRFEVGAVESAKGGLAVKFILWVPTVNIADLIAWEVQIRDSDAGLWPDDLENTLNIRGIQAQGTARVKHGTNSFVTSAALNTAWSNQKLVYTHEGVDLATGEVNFPKTYILGNITDNGDGTFTVEVKGGDKVLQTSNGSPKTINFIIFDQWTKPPDSELERWEVGTLQNFKADPTATVSRQVPLVGGAFYRARWVNRKFGAGPWIYWDGVDGSTVKADASTLLPTLMDGAFLLDNSVPAEKIIGGVGGKAIASDIVFTAVDHRRFTWGAATVKFEDGSTESINLGDSGNLLTNTTYWIVKILGDPALLITTNFADAVGSDRVQIALAVTTSNTDEFVSVVSPFIQGQVISAALGVFGKLSSISAQLGEIETGEVAVNGSLTFHDGADILFLNSSDSNASALIFREDGGTFEAALFNRVGTEVIELVPKDDNRGRLELGDADSRWNSIILGAVLNVRPATDGTVNFGISSLRWDIIFANTLNLGGGNLVSIGDIELDSISKDGAGTIVFNDPVRMFNISSGSGMTFDINGSQSYLFEVGGTVELHLTSSVFTMFSGVAMPNLPTSDPGVAGRLWNDGGTVKVSAG